MKLMDDYMAVEIKMQKEAIEQLEKENSDLKARLHDISVHDDKIVRENKELKKQIHDNEILVNTIMEQIPTKEHIVEVLEKYSNEDSGDVNCGYFNAIATEILKGNGGEEAK